MSFKKLWRFHCFLSERGTDLIDEWHAKTISKRGKAKFERALEHLCAQPKMCWERPHASPLGDNIYVIRFSDENRTQHRVAGHFNGDSIVFVLTQPAIEKDDTYIPRNLVELAKGHKATCDADFAGRTRPCFQLTSHQTEDSGEATSSMDLLFLPR